MLPKFNPPVILPKLLFARFPTSNVPLRTSLIPPLIDCIPCMFLCVFANRSSALRESVAA